MLPTTVIIFGNPKGGTSLMQAYPDMALDLPFRVLIREESDGRVVVGYHPVEILQTYGPDTAAIQPLKNLEKLVQKAIRDLATRAHLTRPGRHPSLNRC
jgi:uncharacterized protein (DUF302 family)